MQEVEKLWKCSKPEFIKDGEAGNFRYLGIEFERFNDGSILAHQNAFVRDLLKKYGVENTRQVNTTGDPTWLGSPPPAKVLQDASVKQCQEALGSLLWLSTRTRCDLAYAVSQAATRAANDPKRAWFQIKRIFRYLSSHPTRGVHMISENHSEGFKIETYTDASWAPTGEKSYSGMMILLNGCPVLWKSNKQASIAMSSAEAELVAMSQPAHYMLGLEAVLYTAGIPTKIKLYGDNLAAIATIKGCQSWRSKFYMLRANRLRECIDSGVLEIDFVPGIRQIADILTKYSSRAVLITCQWLANIKEFKDGKWTSLEKDELKVLQAEFAKRDKNVKAQCYAQAIRKYQRTDERDNEHRKEDFKYKYQKVRHILSSSLNEEGVRHKNLISKRKLLYSMPNPLELNEPEKPKPGAWYCYPVNIWKQSKGDEYNQWIWIPGGKYGKWGTNWKGTFGVLQKEPWNPITGWNLNEDVWCQNCGKTIGPDEMITGENQLPMDYAPGPDDEDMELCPCERSNLHIRMIPTWNLGTHIIKENPLLEEKALENHPYVGSTSHLYYYTLLVKQSPTD
jgi:hypothetical protein